MAAQAVSRNWATLVLISDASCPEICFPLHQRFWGDAAGHHAAGAGLVVGMVVIAHDFPDGINTTAGGFLIVLVIARILQE
jgi:hypothetical protein